MSAHSLAEVPFAQAYEAAIELVRVGEDPELVLASLVFPRGSRMYFEPAPEGQRQLLAAWGYCPNGHPWDEVNTYIGPNEVRKCRACARERKRSRRERPDQKVPCVYCGTLCTAPTYKRRSSHREARCSKCYHEQRRAAA